MKLLPTPTNALLAGGALLLSISCAPAQTDAAPAAAGNGQGQARRNGQGQNRQGQNRQGQNRQGQNRNRQGQGRNAANQGAQGTGDATAFAQIPASNRKVAVPPPDAPQDVTMKPSNFPVPAGAIYVSPDASPNGAGTQDSPSPLKAALQKAPQGSTVVLRGGIYRDGNLTIARKITLQNAPGEVAWLDGSDVVTGWVADGNAWKRDNWETTFPQALGREHIDPAYPLANNRDMVWVNGRYGTQVATRGEVGAGKFFVDYAGKTK